MKTKMTMIGAVWLPVLLSVSTVLAHEGHEHSEGPRRITGGGPSSFFDQIGVLGIAGLIGLVGIILIVALVSRR